MTEQPKVAKFNAKMSIAVDKVTKIENSAFQRAYMAAAKAMADWNRDAHDYQIEPLGEWWSVWLFLAGRGAGKTRTAAETLRDWAWGISNSRWLVSAPTYSSLSRVCFTGESGLLAVIPEEMIESFNSSDLILKLVNGAIIEGISAESKERFRGPQFHGGWCDELAAWQYAEEAWDLMMMGMRLGQRPRIIATTTPKPRPLIARLYKDPHTVVTRASTYENLEHLAPTMQRELLKYEGTSYGRQEIYGELLDPEEAGIIKRSWIRLWPRDEPLPKFEFVLISLDTAYTEKTRDRKTGDTDPTACVVAGLFRHKGKLGIVVLECWEEWLGLPDLIRKVKDEMKVTYGDDEHLPLYTAPGQPRRPQALGRKADLVLIEEKGSGISLVQMLQREGIYPWTYNPGKADKLLRLHQVSHLFKAGFFWVLESKANPGQPMSWTEGLINQLCTFHGEGSTKHDDYVDATTQLLRYFADQMELAADAPPVLPEDEVQAKPVVNVYAA